MSGRKGGKNGVKKEEKRLRKREEERKLKLCQSGDKTNKAGKPLNRGESASEKIARRRKGPYCWFRGMRRYQLTAAAGGFAKKGGKAEGKKGSEDRPERGYPTGPDSVEPAAQTGPSENGVIY